MRFAPLEIKNGWVFVILWTAKVIKQTEKINGSIDFLSKNHRLYSPKCPRCWRRKINLQILLFLVGENYHSKSILILVSGLFSWLSIELSERKKYFFDFHIFSMIFIKIVSKTLHKLMQKLKKMIFWRFFREILDENHRKIWKSWKYIFSLRQFVRQSCFEAGNRN